MEETRRYFNSGTCKTLKESPYMLVIFVDDDESKWNQNEINKYWKDQIVLSKKFIENQAKKYNINLNID